MSNCLLGERNLSKHKSAGPLIALSHPQSHITEAYRTIRTNLQYASVDVDTKVISLTSSGPGEGKTSTTSNLAIVAAQAGKRVLIIDADLRKPQIHIRFRASNLYGLSNVLTRETSLDEAIVQSGSPNLFLLPSGPIPPNPSEILSSRAFRELLESCRQTYDLVLVDTPPVLAVADALIVTPHVDGTILVVDSQATNRKAALQAKIALEQVRGRILGVVLNRVKRSRGDGYYYYYPQYGQVAEAKL